MECCLIGDGCSAHGPARLLHRRRMAPAPSARLGRAVFLPRFCVGPPPPSARRAPPQKHRAVAPVRLCARGGRRGFCLMALHSNCIPRSGARYAGTPPPSASALCSRAPQKRRAMAPVRAPRRATWRPMALHPPFHLHSTRWRVICRNAATIRVRAVLSCACAEDERPHEVRGLCTPKRLKTWCRTLASSGAQPRDARPRFVVVWVWVAGAASSHSEQQCTVRAVLPQCLAFASG